MIWIVALSVVIGVVVLVASPLVERSRAPKDPAAQPDAAAGGPSPPARPDRPVPGSRADRERKGAR